jgi:hypothetical protein
MNNEKKIYRVYSCLHFAVQIVDSFDLHYTIPLTSLFPKVLDGLMH